MITINMNSALQEANLVWLRYTAFVVLNGFLVNAIAQDASDGKMSDLMFILIGVFGMTLNASWHILNYSGWKNQYIYIHYATISAGDRYMGRPYNDFTDPKNINDFGIIYVVAQIVPAICFCLAGVSTVCGLFNTTYNDPCDDLVKLCVMRYLDTSFPVGIFALSCIIFAYAIERYCLYPIGLEEIGRDVV
jgi:hypothetical protein